MAVSTLTNTVGTGLWAAGSAVFLTRSSGLSTGVVGAGLTIAALTGLATNIPVGNASDRRDPGRARAAVQVLQALAAASFVLVDDVATFVVVATVDAALGAAALTLRGALIAAIVAPDRRVHAFAVLRTAASFGISAGVAAAGLVLALDTRQAYAGLALARACTYLVSAGLHLRLPRLSARPAPDRGDAHRGALRDLPYLGVMATTALLSLNSAVMFFAVPLWVMQETDAPLPLIAGLLLVRTAMSVLLTVPLSRGMEATPSASHAIRRAGALLALGMLFYAASGLTTNSQTVLLLLLATVVCAAAELLYVTATSGLSYALADGQRIGNYQGATNLLQGLVLAAGPALLTLLVLQRGPAGWLGLAALFAGAGLTAPALITWAQRTRRAQ